MAQKRREKAAREHRDITQVDVAAAAGVSKTAVSRYESDTDNPRDATLERIATFLDTTPAFLRYGVADTGSASGAEESRTPLASYRIPDAIVNALAGEPPAVQEPKPTERPRAKNARGKR